MLRDNILLMLQDILKISSEISDSSTFTSIGIPIERVPPALPLDWVRKPIEAGKMRGLHNAHADSVMNEPVIHPGEWQNFLGGWQSMAMI